MSKIANNEIWDVTDGGKYDDLIAEFVKKDEVINTHPKYKLGQWIAFTGGYHDNIRMKSKITGFDKDGSIYLTWDCYWFPIRDEAIRNIQLIEKK